jgi:hypothetical protein
LREDEVGAEQEDGVGQAAPAVIHAQDEAAVGMVGSLLVELEDEIGYASHVHWAEVVAQGEVLDGWIELEDPEACSDWEIINSLRDVEFVVEDWVYDWWAVVFFHVDL